MLARAVECLHGVPFAGGVNIESRAALKESRGVCIHVANRWTATISRQETTLYNNSKSTYMYNKLIIVTILYNANINI